MIELQATVDGQARGGIMFPAGLKQGAGVRVGLDGKMSEQPLSIRECSERGCAAVFNFAKVAFDKLRAGKVLELHVTGGDGRPAAYGLSLVGFDSAVRRSLALPD
jgi:invasion protein IalB